MFTSRKEFGNDPQQATQSAWHIRSARWRIHRSSPQAPSPAVRHTQPHSGDTPKAQRLHWFTQDFFLFRAFLLKYLFLSFYYHKFTKKHNKKFINKGILVITHSLILYTRGSFKKNPSCVWLCYIEKSVSSFHLKQLHFSRLSLNCSFPSEFPVLSSHTNSLWGNFKKFVENKF